MKRKVLRRLAIGILFVGTGVMALLLILRFVALAGVIGLFWHGTPIPKPEIRKGEFPIKVTYEVSGETKIAEDIIVCEFDGIENLGEGGKIRKWKGYLKSGNEHITLLKNADGSELYCEYGMPEYYMGDLQFTSKTDYEARRQRNFDTEFLILEERQNGEEISNRFISAAEAWETYHLKVLDVEYTPPIENIFR